MTKFKVKSYPKTGLSALTCAVSIPGLKEQEGVGVGQFSVGAVTGVPAAVVCSWPQGI